MMAGKAFLSNLKLLKLLLSMGQYLCISLADHVTFEYFWSSFYDIRILSLYRCEEKEESFTSRIIRILFMHFQ